ncbi:MAG: hypothetical protein HKN76_03590 [Saprospiraceae bacterium]|nr:hypothetical protein [Saprospiraceae bacterium]
MKRMGDFLFLSLFCLNLSAQNVLSISPGASGGSQGGVKSVHQDILAMYGNEAGLAFINEFQVYASAEKRFNTEGLNFYSLVAAMPTSLGNFGATIQYHGFDEFNEQLLGLAYGRHLLDQLAIGAQFDFVQVSIPTYGRTSTFTAEFGIQSRIVDQLLLGFHVYNPFEIKWIDQETLPTVFTAGLAYQPTDKVSIMAEVEKVADFRENIKFGIQYWLINELALRIGFNSNPSLVTFGIGYALSSGFSFDVGSGLHQELGFSPLGGIGYRSSKP